MKVGETVYFKTRVVAYQENFALIEVGDKLFWVHIDDIKEIVDARTS